MLKIRNIHKAFNIGRENEKRVLSGFNLDIEENTVTAIIGPNGCGKSTLMNIIGGSLKPEAGEIVLDDIHLEELDEVKRSKYIGRVYQDPSMGVAPSLTILENLSLAENKGQKYGFKRLVKKDRINHFVDSLKTLDLGLENQLDTRVMDLSGGQRQSLSLLIATMNRPKLLLLDEHTAALDPKTSKVVMDRTEEVINQNDITTLMISHDMRDAVNYSDRIIMLDEGKVVLDIKSEETSPEELENIYRGKIEERLVS